MQSNLDLVDGTLRDVTKIIRDNDQHFEQDQKTYFRELQAGLRKREDELTRSQHRDSDVEESTRQLRLECEELASNIRKAIESNRQKHQETVVINARPAADSIAATRQETIVTNAQPAADSGAPTSSKTVRPVKMWPRPTVDRPTGSSSSNSGTRSQAQATKTDTSSRRPSRPSRHASSGVPPDFRALTDAAARLAEGASRTTRRNRTFDDYTYAGPTSFEGSVVSGLTINNGGYQNTGSVITYMPTPKSSRMHKNDEA